MPTRRPLAAIVLYGGWLLLFNPDRQRPNASLHDWKRVHEYDTAYLCDQGRREKMRSDLEKEARKPSQPPVSPTDLELRYRCERVEHVGK